MKLLDLFCGAGGCSVGYHRAGFTDITGVDLAPMPRYPFRFIQADALEFLASVQPGEYDLIHASPPCQGYSRMRHLPWLKGNVHPLLIDPVRVELRRIGTPWVMENVEGAPLENALLLCGTMFGLKCYRHRLFESSFRLLRMYRPRHAKHTVSIGSGRQLNTRTQANAEGWVSQFSKVADGARAFQIDWMTRDELRQAIPPAYTEWIGKQMLRSLEGVSA